MTINVDDDIVNGVILHRWKWRERLRPVKLVEIHTTRSTRREFTALQEYGATMNWAKATSNRTQGRTEIYGSMMSFICGGGRICRVLPDRKWPHYSLGHADPLAISIEIAQATIDTPILDVDLDNAALIAAHYSAAHNIPPKVLPWLSEDNHEAPGYVRHDRSSNGRTLGKSDPGPLFNDQDFERRVKRHLQQDVEVDEMWELFRTKTPDRREPIYLGWFNSQGQLALHRWVADMETVNALRYIGVPTRDKPVAWASVELAVDGGKLETWP